MGVLPRARIGGWGLRRVRGLTMGAPRWMGKTAASVMERRFTGPVDVDGWADGSLWDVRPRLAGVIMGVSGCGKSTVAALLAETLGCSFIEADDYHSQANKGLT
ncbi:hypothetical protein E2562_032464 [Oryza meyeriana var. granulata]|uniref:gluconokinase n=1 Tax=Oryza meyeriana var. granulata TaxID=110450 RepID=A0A6G1FER9_9ORYZ|nr:hypothetical protein E2562_032464 [Oryza meyeriana var. granulata]